MEKNNIVSKNEWLNKDELIIHEEGDFNNGI